MNAIHLEAKQVPNYLRGGYAGKKFKVIVAETVTINSDAGVWSGGSRDHYSAIDINTGHGVALPGQQTAPWHESRRDQTITLVPGLAIVRRSMFNGTDMGLTFYVHAENAAKLLPAPCEALSEHEKTVLNATRSLKSSYNGRDRYQMTCVDRLAYGALPSMTRDEWNAAKESLIAKKLLNKAGAITPAGKNAARD